VPAALALFGTPHPCVRIWGVAWPKGVKPSAPVG